MSGGTLSTILNEIGGSVLSGGRGNLATATGIVRLSLTGEASRTLRQFAARENASSVSAPQSRNALSTGRDDRDHAQDNAGGGFVQASTSAPVPPSTEATQRIRANRNRALAIRYMRASRTSQDLSDAPGLDGLTSPPQPSTVTASWAWQSDDGIQTTSFVVGNRLVATDNVAAQGDCVGCQQAFATGQQLLCTPCIHLVHAECLTPWVQEEEQRFHRARSENASAPPRCRCPVCNVDLMDLQRRSAQLADRELEHSPSNEEATGSNP